MDKTNPIDHPRTYAALMEASDADGAHEVCDLCAKLEEENARLRENINAWMRLNCVLFVFARDREIKCLSPDKARDNQKQMIADGWKHTSTIDPARWIEALINHPEGLDEESNRLMDELQFGVSALPND